MYYSYSVQSQEDFTAILNTKASVALDDVVPLQNEIDREIAILRLFRVGAIKYVIYSMEIDSVLNMFSGSIHGGGYTLVGPDKYLIKEEDIEPLKTFWSNLKRVELPASALPNSVEEIDMVSIAFERYSDSLDSRVFEKRLSSAVMGLEALYLSGGSELSYTLQMRVSKMLSLIGYDPHEVQKAIKDAYKIRSTYVHGGFLSEKERENIERKFGNLIEFSRLVMDYLRASIVAWLMRPNKSALIQKIDESLLDAKKEVEVKSLLFIP